MRKSMMFVFIISCVVAVAAGENLTVYNGGYALYGESIRFDMESGINTYRLDDVPETIDTGSITIYPTDSAENISILEQNYDYDIVGTAKMLKK